MTQPATQVHRAQAVIFGLLTLVCFTAYIVPLSVFRAVLVAPFVVIPISWVTLSFFALIRKESGRAMAPVYVSHLISFFLMLALVLGANRGLWRNLWVPAISGAILGLLALFNYRAALKVRE